VSVVDLHPEDLIDKDGRGGLTEAESIRLHVHLARCATCRFERQLRADFADELSGEPRVVNVAALLESRAVAAPPVVAAAAASASAAPGAAGAMTGNEAPEPITAPQAVDDAHADREIALRAASSYRALPRRRRMQATWLVAAATLLGVSVAGASGVGSRAWSWLAERADTSSLSVKVASLPSSPAAAPTVHSSARVRATEARGAQSRVDVTDVDVRAPEAAAPPRRRDDPARHAASSPVASVAPAPMPPMPEDASTLFEAANDARRHGDYGRALAIHRDLQARFGRSQEARVARATVGRLLLDRGDPAGALESFDAYLGDGAGALGEEAMAGRATALDRLGRTEDARRAWSALLAAYPDSAYGAHARARIAGAPSR
jgi:TolA-binding protein